MAQELIDSVLDAEKIISEVEIRPALYTKQLKEYSDRNIKEKLWGKVCVNIIGNWMELSGTEKQKEGQEIQKKWKNLKDCFSRELALQRKLKSGEPAKKRRKYVYFDSLLFLLPFMKVRPTAPLENSNNNNQEELDTVTPHSLQSNSNNSVTNKEDHLNATPRRGKKAIQKTTSPESSLLQILQEKQNEEINEDKQSALMLVPMLKKINDEQKHYAQVEILHVMRYAKNYHPSFVQYQDMHHSNIVSPTYFAHAARCQPPSQSTSTSSSFQMQPPRHTQSVSHSTLTNNQNQNSECSLRSYYSQHSEDSSSSTAASSSCDYSIPSSPALPDNNSELFDMSNQ